MNRPDIAFLMHSFSLGGAERTTVNLANQMAKKGLKIDLVIFTSKGPLGKDVLPLVRTIDLDAHHSISAVLRLFGYLRRERPFNAISIHTHIAAVAALGRMILGLDTKMIFRAASTLSRDLASPRCEAHHPASIRFALRILPFLLRRFDRIVAVSNGVAKDLADNFGIPPQKISTIHKPLLHSEILMQSKEEPDHPWFKDSIPVVLGVGRFTAAKDFPTLIRAFADLLSRRPARLIILGDGPERTRLEDLIRDLRIENDASLPGFVNNPFSFMRKSSAFVLSSKWEGMPNALLEAMICGCPVVSTNCESGPAEVLDGGKYGELVPTGDSAALSKAINKVLTRPPGRVPTEWLQRFSMETALKEYWSIIHHSPGSPHME